MQLSLAWEKGDSQAAALAADELRSVLPEEIVARTGMLQGLEIINQKFNSKCLYCLRIACFQFKFVDFSAKATKATIYLT